MAVRELGWKCSMDRRRLAERRCQCVSEPELQKTLVDIHITTVATDTVKYTCPRAVVDWNQLDENIFLAPSVSSFREKLQEHQH